MKKKIWLLFLSAGWLLLVLFLLSTYLFNRLSIQVDGNNFQPITWENQIDFFNGALVCTLTDEKLLERKQFIKEKLFVALERKEASANGYIYYFKDDENLLELAMEFIKKEKACCPFFKFDLSILPYNHGFALQLSGSAAAMDIIQDFEKNEF